MKDSHDTSRRKFVKALGYVAPAIITLKAAPAFASVGSGRHDNGPRGNNRWHGNDRHDSRGGFGHNNGRGRRDDNS